VGLFRCNRGGPPRPSLFSSYPFDSTVQNQDRTGGSTTLDRVVQDSNNNFRRIASELVIPGADDLRRLLGE
jgi:hypothetical protein